MTVVWTHHCCLFLPVPRPAQLWRCDSTKSLEFPGNVCGTKTFRKHSSEVLKPLGFLWSSRTLRILELGLEVFLTGSVMYYNNNLYPVSLCDMLVACNKNHYQGKMSSLLLTHFEIGIRSWGGSSTTTSRNAVQRSIQSTTPTHLNRQLSFKQNLFSILFLKVF